MTELAISQIWTCLISFIYNHTAKNPEKKSRPFLENEDFLSQNEQFFLSNRRIICRFEKKMLIWRKILIFEKWTDFFLTIFPSAILSSHYKQ